MVDILFIRSIVVARIGVDITDHHVILYFKLNACLIEAASFGNLNSVEYLVSNGADIHTINDYALRLSARNGYLNVVEYLVYCGANIHAENEYALQWAYKNRHPKVVEYLMKARARRIT